MNSNTTAPGRFCPSSPIPSLLYPPSPPAASSSPPPFPSILSRLPPLLFSSTCIHAPILPTYLAYLPPYQPHILTIHSPRQEAAARIACAAAAAASPPVPQQKKTTACMHMPPPPPHVVRACLRACVRIRDCHNRSLLFLSFRSHCPPSRWIGRSRLKTPRMRHQRLFFSSLSWAWMLKGDNLFMVICMYLLRLPTR
ncbi:hypothetical protein GGR56DRAFT_489146 [Xylariaceae sp. FL0804]|nr:hypothetical protein GGR56DRAFT_489146 [Xylariaceae sp. FL0804]